MDGEAAAAVGASIVTAVLTGAFGLRTTYVLWQVEYRLAAVEKALGIRLPNEGGR